MRRILEQQSLIRRHFIFILGLCMCLYFSYHSVQGERSVPELFALNAAVERAQADLENLKRERSDLESQVVMLRPDTIKPDFLEQRARIVLGYVSEDEIAIVRD